MSTEESTFMKAADAARAIADGLATQAKRHAGEDRRQRLAMSAGARLVAVKLIELADEAGSPADD